jgi:hypothetical protein
MLLCYPFLGRRTQNTALDAETSSEEYRADLPLAAPSVGRYEEVPNRRRAAENGGRKLKMSLLPVATLCLALVASIGTPVFADTKSVEMRFQFAGTILDERRNTSGTFAISLSGRFRETAPDLQVEDSGVYVYGPFAWNSSWTEYMGDNKTQYKVEVSASHYEFRQENYYQYSAKGYDAQASYSGRLFVIWGDGSTSSFTINLNPAEIDKFTYQSSLYEELRDEQKRMIYQWNPELNDWIFIGENTTRYGVLSMGNITRNSFNIPFVGSIKGKDGRQNGLLVLSKTETTETVAGTRYWDDFSEDFEYTSVRLDFAAMGKFGPYMLTAYTTS